MRIIIAAAAGVAGALLATTNSDVILPFCLFCVIVAVMDFVTKKNNKRATII